MTGGLDIYWRRCAVAASGLTAGQHVLDVATGTGDLALALTRRVVPGGQVIGVDHTGEMLNIARRKAGRCVVGRLCRFVEAEALPLPFADNSFDCATIGFALRNIEDKAGCLSEMCRVVRPGGRVLVLELARPLIPVYRQLSLGYLRYIVPLIGWAVQDCYAGYAYLYRSLVAYPERDTISTIMYHVGLRSIVCRNLSGGIVSLHIGEA